MDDKNGVKGIFHSLDLLKKWDKKQVSLSEFPTHVVYYNQKITKYLQFVINPFR